MPRTSGRRRFAVERDPEHWRFLLARSEAYFQRLHGTGTGREVLLVRLGERLSVAARELRRGLLPALIQQGFGEVIGPGAGRLRQQQQDGVIADFEGAETMLRQFIRKAHTSRKMIRPRIIVGVPSGITRVEKNAVREAAQSAGASEVFLIDQPIAAAIGADLPVTEPVCSMVVDIGGGTTQVAVMSLAGIVYSKSVRVGGDKMDEAIMQYMEQRHNLLIGEQSAESRKTTIGNALAEDAAESVQLKGRDSLTGIPKSVVIDSNEVRDALTEPVRVIVVSCTKRPIAMFENPISAT